MVFERITGAAKCTGRWIWDHKIAIGVTTVAIGGGVYYVYNKVTNTLDQYSSQFALEIQKQKKQAFYEGIESPKTIQREFKWIQSCLERNIPFPSQEEIAAQTKSCSKEERIAFWEDMKVLNMTRLFTALYSQILFSLSMRIHLTLIARYIFLSASEEEETSAALFSLDDATQLSFLAEARYIFESGMSHLRNHIECIVHEQMNKWKITSPCSYDDLVNIIRDVREEVETTEARKSVLLNFMLPPEETTTKNKEFIKFLENEVRNIFETQEFNDVLHGAFDIGFRELEGIFCHKYEIKSEQAKQEAESFTIYIAKLIPVIEQVTAHLQEPSNAILQSTLNNVVLDKFAYEIYDVSASH